MFRVILIYDGGECASVDMVICEHIYIYIEDEARSEEHTSELQSR